MSKQSMSPVLKSQLTLFINSMATNGMINKTALEITEEFNDGREDKIETKPVYAICKTLGIQFKKVRKIPTIAERNSEILDQIISLREEMAKINQKADEIQSSIDQLTEMVTNPVSMITDKKEADENVAAH